MMANRYQGLQPIEMVGEALAATQVGLAGGYELSTPSRVAALDTSPSMNAVRFENGAVRKDFGYRALGSAAASRILGLGEHKFIEDGQKYQRLVRLSRSGTKLKLDVWSGGQWIEAAVSAEDVADRYLSLVSMLGVFLIADGEKIFKWDEVPSIVSGGNDFPAGNTLDAAAEETTLVVSPAGALDNKYHINFDVVATGPSASGISIVIGFGHEGVEFAERTFLSASSADPGFVENWNNQEVILERELADGDEISIVLKSVQASDAAPIVITVDDDADEPTVNFFGTRVDSTAAVDDEYKFKYDLDLSASEAGSFQTSRAEVDLYYDSGSGYQLIQHLTHWAPSSAPYSASISHTFVQAGLGAGDKFAIRYEVIPGGQSASGDYGGPGVNTISVEYSELSIGGAFGAEVHGHNLGTDGDASLGVSYDRYGPGVSALTLLSADAPGARIIAPFGDYLLALRDGGDSQSLAWCANGDVEEWVAVDSGQIFLASAQADAIDDLMGFAELTFGVGALFRKRSIMRTFFTGNVDQSIGAVNWLPMHGTESPFSIQNVLGGVMYLGFDREVYYLTESGPVGVSAPIHQELLRTLTGDPELVDSAYDGAFHEYILGVPEGNSSNITKLWYFNVKDFVTKNKVVWRSRDLAVERIAAVSQV